MNGDVIRLRPRAYYTIAPGAPPDDPEPVFYARTLDGLNSAIAHAELLSAGGGIQYITITEGRWTWIWKTFQAGGEVPSPEPPVRYRTAAAPAPDQVRPGSPGGHIPEKCTHAKHRAEPQRKQRRSPNMPKTPPYETTLAQIQQTLGETR